MGPLDGVAETAGGEQSGSVQADRREELVTLYRQAADCTRCPLAETRQKVVFGAGNANAELMFVGEGPGAQEDKQGLPFVGRAGGLLNELLAGVGLERNDVWITNVVKCRPPGNRDPHPAEIEACSGYLTRQLELIRPRVVATLGNFATRLLTRSRDPISRVRGTPQLHTLGGTQVFVFPIFHPAAALRTPSLKQSLEADFRALRELTDRPLPNAIAPPEPGELQEPVSTEPAPAATRDQLDIFG